MALTNPNTNPSSLITHLNGPAQQLLNAALSESTKCAYKRSWDLFKQWSDTTVSLPVPTVKLCNFIGYLFSTGLAPSTVSSHISAIGYIHKVCDLQDPTQSFLTRKILKGCHSLQRTRDSRLPITLDILSRMINALEHIIPNFVNKILLKSFFLLAFNGFFRIGELAVKSKGMNSVLLRNDVHFDYQDEKLIGVRLILRQFKTNYDNSPFTIYISSNPSSKNCPVTALNSYLSIFKHSNGPLYQFIDNTPVSYTYISERIRQAISFIGLNPKHYKGHSFRIGAATHAASVGMSENVIQNMGRWSSNAMRRYVRLSTVST